MEGEEIGLVLARASDLRSKISACISMAAPLADASGTLHEAAAEVVKEMDEAAAAEEEEEEAAEEEEEEAAEVESLVSISDALESLERQLAALQDLQQQQRYERETILNQIDRSRRVLLNKLKEYKGQDWEVIHEASAFAGEKIEHDDGLILPPYSNHVTNSFVLDDVYPSNYASKSTLLHNGLVPDGIDEDNSRNGLENSNARPSSSNSAGGIRSFVGWMTKSVITVVGVVSILRVAGYKPVIRKNGIKFETSGLFRKVASGETQQATVQCPPGKVLVVEDGNAQCVVKERVEVPFDTNVIGPNAKYGFG